jgi:hypothetical protein
MSGFAALNPTYEACAAFPPLPLGEGWGDTASSSKLNKGGNAKTVENAARFSTLQSAA